MKKLKNSRIFETLPLFCPYFTPILLNSHALFTRSQTLCMKRSRFALFSKKRLIFNWFWFWLEKFWFWLWSFWNFILYWNEREFTLFFNYVTWNEIISTLFYFEIKWKLISFHFIRSFCWYHLIVVWCACCFYFVRLLNISNFIKMLMTCNRSCWIDSIILLNMWFVEMLKSHFRRLFVFLNSVIFLRNQSF